MFISNEHGIVLNVSTVRSYIETYLEHLRGLPFVRGVVENVRPRLNRHDFGVTIQTARGTYRFRVDELGSHLDQATLNRILGRARDASAPLLLFAPYVSQEAGARLANGGVAFVDRVGNCYLNLGDNYVAHNLGRRPPRTAERSGFRAPAYKVLFVLLADTNRTAAPLREVARLAGVSLGTVAAVMKRLRTERFIVGPRSKPQMVGATVLLDRWVSAYADLLRPRLVAGRYDTGSADPEVVEAGIQTALANRVPWALGGTAAGHRLTRHYRGEETVLHIASGAEATVIRRLKALPRRDGNMLLVHPPAPLALQGPLPHVAHPLLVYAEMLCAPSPRAAEAAREIRDRFLKLP
jgi:hypothetical protein